MPLPMLADPAELAARLRVDPTDALVALAVRRASDRFRAAVRHPVTQVLGDAVVINGSGSDTLLLPVAPVTAIASVTITWPALTGMPPTLVTGYQADRAHGILRRDADWWPDGLGNIEVVCDHGYPADQVPGDIADAVLEQAEQQYLALAGIEQAHQGQQAINFGKNFGGVTQRWVEAVARYQLGGGDRS